MALTALDKKSRSGHLGLLEVEACVLLSEYPAQAEDESRSLKGSVSYS